MKKYKKLWALLALLIVGGGGVWYFQRPQKSTVSWRVLTVEKGTLRRTVLATGQVQPQNRLEIKSPIAGRIESVLVKEGQSVRQGQVLAWLSSAERAALLDAARAKGPEELAHWRDLYKPTPLVAALDGEIISRNIEPGQTVTGSDAVLVMSDRLIVKTQVDETDIGQIKINQPATVTLDAYPEHNMEGHVDHIAFEAKTVNNVTIYEVDVLPTRVPPFMRSGMTANVSFLVDQKENVLLLPTVALKQTDTQWEVQIPGAQASTPVKQRVEIGLTDGKNTEILSGLSEGDHVMVPDSMGIPAAKNNGNNPFSPMGRRPSSGTRRGS